MALTILERPEGHILETTQNYATVNESYGAGDAQFVSNTPHGLTDGDYIYSESVIEDYAGFFYVDVITTGIFKLRPYPTGDYVQFINNGSITWRESTYTHGWSAVHLPITYRISTNLYPDNGSDTVRNVSSSSNVNGWTVLNISGSLGTIHSYDFVTLTVPNDTGLSGVYQIVEWVSATVMVINLAYDSGNNFTSATIQKYYNNYNILVRVYAGLNASHQWATQKPYELAATLKLIPDDNNEVFFSINEVLKSYIETRNNLTLGTLPNNIDFFTQFYIETAESYDDSDGYSLGTFTGSFTSDQANFEGYAVNADLEFKNVYSGYLSEYLMTNNTAKFLTLFTIPVLFQCSDDVPDCYQDISFMVPEGEATLELRKQFYLDGVLQTSDTVEIEDSDSGVYRIPLEAECEFNRVDLTLYSSPTTPALNTFIQTSILGRINWTLGASPSITLDGTFMQTSEYLYGTFNGGNGIDYNFNYNVNTTGVGITGHLYMGFLNSSLAELYRHPLVELSGGSNIGSVLLNNPSGEIAYVYMFIDTFQPTPLDFDVDAFTNESTAISETKQFTIDCGCSEQDLTLTWLNNLGGFDYWKFTAQKDHVVEIQEALTTKKNIFPQWPKSYGSQADTIRKQTVRVSNKSYTIRSQHITREEADAIAYLKSSVLVQIINSQTDRRTVIVDTESFVKYKDGDDLYSIAFNVSFTDDIPAQTV